MKLGINKGCVGTILNEGSEKGVARGRLSICIVIQKTRKSNISELKVYTMENPVTTHYGKYSVNS